MKKMLLMISTILVSSSLYSQKEEVNFDSFPNVTISIAPLNGSLLRTNNTFYLKPVLTRKTNKVTFLRFGLGLVNTLSTSGSQFDSDVISGLSSLNFNLGFESFRKLGKRVSLTSGLEVAYQRTRHDEKEILVSRASFFALDGLGFISNPDVNNSRFRTLGLVLFTGLRYHVNQHFQFGVESALGIGNFKLMTTSRRQVGDLELSNTFVDFAAGRHIVFEVNF